MLQAAWDFGLAFLACDLNPLQRPAHPTLIGLFLVHLNCRMVCTVGCKQSFVRLVAKPGGKDAGRLSFEADIALFRIPSSRQDLVEER